MPHGGEGESMSKSIEELEREVTELTAEVHVSQRNQSSRRGLEGARGERGQAGRDGVDGRDGRDGSTITKTEATEVIRDLVQHDESFIAALGAIAMKEFKKRLAEITAPTAA